MAGGVTADIGAEGVEELLGAVQGEGFVPGGRAGQGEKPGAEADDVNPASNGDESITGVEGAVALVEEAGMAGRVAGSG